MKSRLLDGKIKKTIWRGLNLLAFIDVAGDPYSKPQNSPWIAIHAICIRKRSIYDITAQLHRFKRDILLNEHIELKSTDLINRSTLNNLHLDKAKFLEQVVAQCIDHCDCKHAAIVFKNSGDNQKSDDTRLPKHYLDILWRIEAIAREWHVQDVVVVIDNNARKTDRNLAFAFNNYIYRSNGAKELNNILPVPIFADSETTAGLQLADISAGIIRNYYANNLHTGSDIPSDGTYYRKLTEYFNFIKARSINRRISGFNVKGIYFPSEDYRV